MIAHTTTPAAPADRTAAHRFELHEFVSTIVLSLATVPTAWAAYQSTVWSDTESKYSESSADALIESAPAVEAARCRSADAARSGAEAPERAECNDEAGREAGDAETHRDSDGHRGSARVDREREARRPTPRRVLRAGRGRTATSLEERAVPPRCSSVRARLAAPPPAGSTLPTCTPLAARPDAPEGALGDDGPDGAGFDGAGLVGAGLVGAGSSAAGWSARAAGCRRRARRRRARRRGRSWRWLGGWPRRRGVVTDVPAQSPERRHPSPGGRPPYGFPCDPSPCPSPPPP